MVSLHFFLASGELAKGMAFRILRLDITLRHSGEQVIGVALGIILPQIGQWCGLLNNILAWFLAFNLCSSPELANNITLLTSS